METQFNEVDVPDISQVYHCDPTTSSYGFTVLHRKVLTATLHQDDIVDVNETTDNNWTALMMAARNSRTVSSLETVELLLAAGADVNMQNDEGCTALMLASENSDTTSSLETVKALLAAKANANLKNLSGYNALMLASENSNDTPSLKTVKVLLAAGVDPSLVDFVS